MSDTDNLFDRLAYVESWMKAEMEACLEKSTGQEVHIWAYWRGRRDGLRDTLSMLRETCWVGSPVEALENDHA